MRNCLQLILAFLLALILVAATCRAERLSLRADCRMPFNGEREGKYPGYAVEVARLIPVKHDIELDYRTMAWGDALSACGAGRIEAAVSGNTTEAAKLVVPEELIGNPRVRLFKLRESRQHYENVPSLAKVRLGVIQDLHSF